jgi:hypothetical protein
MPGLQDCYCVAHYENIGSSSDYYRCDPCTAAMRADNEAYERRAAQQRRGACFLVPLAFVFAFVVLGVLNLLGLMEAVGPWVVVIMMLLWALAVWRYISA